MHILVLNYEYPPLGGGASPVCHEINKRYVQEGHKVTVVTMGFKNLPQHEVVDGVTVIRINCLRSWLHMCSPHEQFSYIYQSRRFFAKWIPTQEIDVVHGHFILPTGLLCRYLKKKFNLPYFITSHGSDIPGFNPDRFRIAHKFTPAIIRLILADAAAITSPSHYLAGLIRQVDPKVSAKLSIIPNGIDTTQYRSSPKENIILSSGRLLARKGFIELVKSVHRISSAYTVHILGDGPVRNQLQELAAGSSTDIVFHGWLNNKTEAYTTWLSGAAVYCLVSSNENASIAILEAMSSGCAVITSDTSGCPEMVKDAGICIPFGNSEKLRETLIDLIQHPEKISLLGQKARQRAETIYDWKKIMPSYLAMVEQIVNEKQA